MRGDHEGLAPDTGSSQTVSRPSPLREVPFPTSFDIQPTLKMPAAIA